MLALAFIKQRVILLIDYGRDLVARDETRTSDYEREIIDFGVRKYTDRINGIGDKERDNERE